MLSASAASTRQADDGAAGACNLKGQLQMELERVGSRVSQVAAEG